MFNSLEENIFCIYDKALQTYTNLFVANGPSAKAIFEELANDVSSKYYRNQSDYDCVNLGSFDNKRGVINCTSVVKICGLDTFKNEKRIAYQHMIQALNYLPTGYFKMPKEMQEEIKKDIEKAVQDYAKFENEQIRDIPIESLSS